MIWLNMAGPRLQKTDTFYAYYGLSQLYAGKDADAAKRLTQAVSLNAAKALALYRLGCYHAKKNEFELAFGFFEKAFATHGLTAKEIRSEEDTFWFN